MPDSDLAIQPHRTALLVMDYQQGVVAMMPESAPMLDRVAALIDAARQNRITVGYVRVAFEDADFDAVPETNTRFSALAAGGRRFAAGAPETAIHDRIAPEPDDLVVRKVRVGAFSTTDLDRQLRDRGIDTLILAGIATSGVVLSTVREGADKDYRLIVVEDACYDADPEVHAVLTTKVFPRQAEVVSIQDVVGALG